jgi:NTP pyrophosphatase (non-canonical NTP hydrolase)
MTIGDLIREAFATALDKGWNDRFVSVGEDIALMHSELSEALEEHRAGHATHQMRLVDGKPEGVPAELADVMIRIGHFCGRHDIDLGAAIEAKLEYNRTRPHRHGGKVL